MPAHATTPRATTQGPGNAVVAGYRSYAAIAEWVADLPVDTAAAPGTDVGRRPSEAVIRRLLRTLDPDRPATASRSGRGPHPSCTGQLRDQVGLALGVRLAVVRVAVGQLTLQPFVSGGGFWMVSQVVPERQDVHVTR